MARTRFRSATVLLGPVVALAMVVGSPSADATGGGAAGRGHSAARALLSHPAARFSVPPKRGVILEPESAYPLKLKHGYLQREFFASGRARAYKPKAQPISGKWAITRTSTSGYRTRVLVRRPPRST